jgi:hypothetical protein
LNERHHLLAEHHEALPDSNISTFLQSLYIQASAFNISQTRFQMLQVVSQYDGFSNNQAT